MKLSDVIEKAKALVHKRGGTESVKQDAEELTDVAKEEGSTTDKAKDAFEAVKEPGAPSQ